VLNLEDYPGAKWIPAQRYYVQRARDWRVVCADDRGCQIELFGEDDA
jgi:hypothetical protein